MELRKSRTGHLVLVAGLAGLGFADLGYVNLVAAPRYVAELERGGAVAATRPAAHERLAAVPARPAAPPGPPAVGRERGGAPAVGGGPGQGAETGRGRVESESAPGEALGAAPPGGGARAEAPAPAAGPAPVLRLPFARGSCALGPVARARLEEAARDIARGPGGRLLLRGHTDRRGTSQSNLELGRCRAESARAFLVAAGFAEGRVEIEAVGESELADLRDTEEAHARNRRVELVWR